jgi:hypothetical protein
MLDSPGMMNTELVSKFHLFNGFLDQLVFSTLTPWLRQLQLVEDSETHRVLLISTYANLEPRSHRRQMRTNQAPCPRPQDRYATQGNITRQGALGPQQFFALSSQEAKRESVLGIRPRNRRRNEL